jgi:hypothetical protein
VSLFRKQVGLVRVVAAVLGGMLLGGCTAWHTTALEPERFSGEQSPEHARLILRDGRRVLVSHPTMVGDSMVWTEAGSTPADAMRRAWPVTGIRRVELRRVDLFETGALLLGAAVLVAVIAGAKSNAVY